MIYNLDVYFMKWRVFKKTTDKMGLDMSALNSKVKKLFKIIIGDIIHIKASVSLTKQT